MRLITCNFLLRLKAMPNLLNNYFWALFIRKLNSLFILILNFSISAFDILDWLSGYNLSMQFKNLKTIKIGMNSIMIKKSKYILFSIKSFIFRAAKVNLCRTCIILSAKVNI